MEKKVIALLVAVSIFVAIFANGAKESGEKNVKLTVYSPGNATSVPTKTIVKYAELVRQASNGNLVLDIHSGGELGNDAEALQSARMGTIDIIFAGTSVFTIKQNCLIYRFYLKAPKTRTKKLTEKSVKEFLRTFLQSAWCILPKVITVCATLQRQSDLFIRLKM